MNDELKKMLSEAFEGKDFASKSDLNEIKTAIEAEIKKLGDNSEMEKKIGSLNEALNSINEELKKAKAGNTPETKFVNFGDLGVRAVTEKKERGSQSAEVELKAGEVFTSSAAATTLNLGVEPGVAKPAMPNFIYRMLPTVSTGLGVVAWTERASHTSGAKVKAEGAVYDKSTTAWIQKSVSMPKIAAYAHYSEELEDDLPTLAADLQLDLSDDMDTAMENLILNGDALSSVKGLKDFATAFSAAGVGHDKNIPNANIFDLIRCCVLQVAKANRKANYVLMNTQDAADMDLQKTADGKYLLPPFMTADSTMIKGVKVIDTNTIPVGSFYVLDTNVTRIYVSRAKSVKIVDQDQDDAIKGMKKAIATQRAVLRVRAHEAAAIVYVAAIPAAITSIAKVTP